jgi:hypothetical protein
LNRRNGSFPEDEFSAAKANLLSIGEPSRLGGDTSIAHKSTVTRIRVDQLPSTLSTLDDRMLPGNGGISHNEVVRFVVANQRLGLSQNELARPYIYGIDRQQTTDGMPSESQHPFSRTTRPIVVCDHYQLTARQKRPALLQRQSSNGRFDAVSRMLRWTASAGRR